MNKTQYLPSAIANYFIGNVKEIDHLRLNKLVYIAYGLALSLLDRKIFNEPVQAWRLGPVVPSVYHEFKYCDNYQPIKKLSYIYHPIKKKNIIPKIDIDDKDLKEVLDMVIEVYGTMPIVDIVDRTHHTGTPWQKVFEEDKNYIEISHTEIKKYYDELLKNTK